MQGTDRCRPRTYFNTAHLAAASCSFETSACGAAAQSSQEEVCVLCCSEAKKTDESTNEADAIAQAHALAQQAAAAAQAEADQCKPVLQVCRPLCQAPCCAGFLL